MLILSSCSHLFDHPDPRTRFSLRLLCSFNAKIQLVGDAKLKRACIAAEDADVASDIARRYLFALAPGEKPWGAASCGLR